MFCTKCGSANAENSLFCTHCGEKIAAAQTVVSTTQISKPKTKDEYFADQCTSTATQRIKIIKILGIVSLAIQCILSVLSALVLISASVAIQNHPVLKDVAEQATSMMLFPIIFLAGFTVASFLLTLKGMKKKSFGFLTAALIVAFLAITFGAAYSLDVPLRQIVIFGTTALHVVMLVFTYKNNKEYKEYLIQSSLNTSGR